MTEARGGAVAAPDAAPVGVGAVSRDAPLGRATTIITFWNLVSRLTGFARVLATATALGIAALGDTYQRTNQVSNVLFELLAGGMLFSVLVPSLVGVLRRDAPTEARQLASALATRAAAVMAVLAGLGLLVGDPLVRALSAGADPQTRRAQVELGVFLLWFVLPQLVLYAVGSVASALLQADHRFAATSMAPAWNNLVVTATMIAFAAVHDAGRGLQLTTGEKVLLGGGTLAGTVGMTAVPLVALWRGGLGLRPRWRVPEADLRSLVTRGLWGAGHVGLNEVLIIATVVLAGWVNGGVIAYQTAFTFFLLPHALLAHPIFTALYPRLSAHGAAGDRAAFARNLSLGLRSMLLLLLPAGGLLAVVSAPSLSVLRFGQLDPQGTRLVALLLAAYLLGISGYSAFFLLTRASYALGDPRLPTLVNLGVTIVTVGSMVAATVTTDGTALLVSFGIIHAVAITGGSVVLYRRVVRLTGAPVPVLAAMGRCGGAALASTAAAFATAATIGWSTTAAAVFAAAASAAVGAAVYVGLLSASRSAELGLVRARLTGLWSRRAS